MVFGPQIFVESQFRLGFVLGAGDKGITHNVNPFCKAEGPCVADRYINKYTNINKLDNFGVITTMKETNEIM